MVELKSPRILDLLGTVLHMKTCYDLLITNFANPLALIEINTFVGLMVAVMSTSLVGAVVRWFYAYRVYILSNRRILAPAAIVSPVNGGYNPYLSFFKLLLSSTSIAMGVTYAAFVMKFGVVKIPVVTWMSATSLGTALGADILIASSMVLYLSRGKQKGFRKMDHVLGKITVYTVNTGLTTTICQAVTLSLTIAYPETFLNSITFYCLGKFYVNSVPAFLNARESLRGNLVTMNSFHLSALPGALGATQPGATTNEVYTSNGNWKESLPHVTD
ncbi:hypothetical protein B0H16DRAFT_1713759 [Mycena metata]|uniref:DUF6534 domain-containing protein n=1 Tax=Mycena metata TaxID=1033252 RepID=A0AAD7NT18_9AGAR|nr:hypothetical protein B0H16DRAFT_1713759 [Mycena metata]